MKMRHLKLDITYDCVFDVPDGTSAEALEEIIARSSVLLADQDGGNKISESVKCIEFPGIKTTDEQLLPTSEPKSFQDQQNGLQKRVIAGLCNIREYPNDLLPHKVFVEEEDENGCPVFNPYLLMSINQSDATCMLRKPTSSEQAEYNLSAIEVDWLITVWNYCRDLMVADGTLRDHAIKCLQGQAAGLESDKIVHFAERSWQNNLPDEENIAIFKKRFAKPVEQWVFLYPLKHFERNVSDEEIIEAYESDKYPEGECECPVQKLTPDEFAELCNDDRFNDQGYYVRFITI